MKNVLDARPVTRIPRTLTTQILRIKFAVCLKDIEMTQTLNEDEFDEEFDWDKALKELIEKGAKSD